MSDGRDALFIARRSDGALTRRPMSPHLQVYRPQITSALSILNRVAGVATSFGTLLMVAWLVAAASTSPYPFAWVQWFLGTWLGLLLLFGWTLALVYHFFAGLRHLAWDGGYGFKLATVHRSGWLAVAATVIVTALIWVTVLAFWPTHVAPYAALPQTEAPPPPASNPAPAQ